MQKYRTDTDSPIPETNYKHYNFSSAVNQIVKMNHVRHVWKTYLYIKLGPKLTFRGL